MALGGVLHDQQAAGFKEHGDLFTGGLVSETEFALRTKTDGGDGGVADDGFFVIAVPTHALVAVVIEIEEAGVVGGAGPFLYDGLQHGEFRSPGVGLFGGAGVAVGEAGIAEPRDFAGGDDALAEDDKFVAFPRHAGKERLEMKIGFRLAEDGSEVVDGAVAREEVGAGVRGDQVHEVKQVARARRSL